MAVSVHRNLEDDSSLFDVVSLAGDEFQMF